MSDLGIAAACGVSPRDLLRAGPLERALLVAAIPAAQENQRRWMRAMAVEAVNAYAEAQRKSR